MNKRNAINLVLGIFVLGIGLNMSSKLLDWNFGGKEAPATQVVSRTPVIKTHTVKAAEEPVDDGANIGSIGSFSFGDPVVAK